ncbi:MAG: ROK family protein [Mariprofundaceae bacterium]|nr:ROK family protein [Mariprofundaceae bacterium]
MKYVLAADVGGTNIRTALIDPAGNIVSEQRQQLNLSACGNSAQHIVATLVSFLQPQAKQATAIGIGFPGFFHGQTGVLAASPNLPALQELPLADILKERLGCSVQVQNDALCAALGEFHFGAARKSDDLLHITLGTGVGGGLILQGKPLYGEGGMACEFGHLCVNTNVDAALCACGKRGCLEAYASATAISFLYHQRTGKTLDAFAIYQSACSQDPAAMHLFSEAGRYIGEAMATAVKLLDIRHITISGGVTGAWEILQPSMIDALEDHVISPQQGHVSVSLSTLKDQGGILGAASMAMGLI